MAAAVTVAEAVVAAMVAVAVAEAVVCLVKSKGWQQSCHW